MAADSKEPAALCYTEGSKSPKGGDRMSKDAIVLLHGFDHDHRCWDLVVDEMAKLAPEVPVYAVDLPGRG